MEAVVKVQLRHQPLNLPLHHQRPSFSSSLSFRIPPPPTPSSLKSSFSIRASSSSSSSSSFSDPSMPNPNIPKPQILETLNPFPFSFLKTVGVAATVATAVFFARFDLKPAVAASIFSAPPSVETLKTETSKNVAKNAKDVAKNAKVKMGEKALEDYLRSHPDDVHALRSLMEEKIKNQKVPEAIGIVDQLATLEPDEMEWPLMKAHLHRYKGELPRAKLAFNEIIEKDPFRVEAYHGLIMVASQSASPNELKEIEKRVSEGMEKCKRVNKNDDTRDFKLLIAQIRVIEGKYDDAFKVYEQLVKEEPRDFRPYLCQGMIYTLLGETKEAQRQFEKYRRLVPKGHPYAKYFTDNMVATQTFGEKVKREGGFVKMRKRITEFVNRW